MLKLIAFDADDTLWHNESLYKYAQDQLAALLSNYAGRNEIDQRLYRKEMDNLPHYGYGIKSFTLSMIETAIDLTEGEISGKQIFEILGFGKRMLEADVHLLEHVRVTIERLAGHYDLMVITKGDLRDQERKLERSSLSPFFEYIEIVSDKHRHTYESLLERHQVAPQSFLMVGNSLRSDIMPVLALGAYAVYIPYHLTWEHELVERKELETYDTCFELEHIGQLPDLIRSLEKADSC
jgi:putative hydrolase of the HAD superfamily